MARPRSRKIVNEGPLVGGLLPLARQEKIAVEQPISRNKNYDLTVKETARFLTKFSQGDIGKCWEWKGIVDLQGYGMFYVTRNNKRPGLKAHRISYEYFVKEIPAELAMDHLCRNRKCVNPAHLEPVTPGENTLRGAAFTALNKAKTHCPQGHPLSGENVKIYQDRRYCRACRRIHNRADKQRKRDAKNRDAV